MEELLKTQQIHKLSALLTRSVEWKWPKNIFLYTKKTWKWRLKLKFLVARKAASQFTRMQICYVFTVFYSLKINRHKNAFKTKIIQKQTAFGFRWKKINFRFFKFFKFLINFFAALCVFTTVSSGNKHHNHAGDWIRQKCSSKFFH